MRSIVDRTETCVLLATHSRHLLDAFSEFERAKLFWVKQGVATAHEDWSDIAVLMDLGALDKGERLLNGEYKYLIWTEDTDTRYLEKFVTANGIASEEFLLFSYSASSKVDAAKLMAAFVGRLRPGVQTIIHRDRDFMSGSEVERLKTKYAIGDAGSTKLFITQGSDIEAYFVSSGHLSATLGIAQDDARLLIETTIQESQNEFVMKFQSKRNEVKIDLYKRDPENCPDTNSLLVGSVVPIEKALGKMLLKKLGPKIQQRSLNAGAVLAQTAALIDPAFQDLIRV